MSELEEACRRAMARSGADGRTSFFAGLVGDGDAVHALQDVTRLPPKHLERLLRGFLSERYADYSERRAHGLGHDARPIDFMLSQGYKRGLRWRDVPLGKSCWDVCIYQQLIQELRPRTLIELGTGLGASALFFLDHCRMFGLDTKIITLDLNGKDLSPKMLGEEAIEFIAGDIKNLLELLPAERLRQLPHPWLVVEDCHAEVPLIVGHLQPFMASGDYLVIEDLGLTSSGSREISSALQNLPKGALMVDTFYTDMFGRNATCSPDSIFRRAGSPDGLGGSRTNIPQLAVDHRTTEDRR